MKLLFHETNENVDSTLVNGKAKEKRRERMVKSLNMYLHV